jgi:hypothetical protein
MKKSPEYIIALDTCVGKKTATCEKKTKTCKKKTMTCKKKTMTCKKKTMTCKKKTSTCGKKIGKRTKKTHSCKPPITNALTPQYSKGQKPKIDKAYIKHTVIVLRGLAALSTKLVLQNIYKQNVSDKRVTKMAKTLDEFVNNYTQQNLKEIGGSVVK